MSVLPLNYQLNLQFTAVVALLSLMDGNNIANLDKKLNEVKNFIQEKLDTLDDSQELDVFINYLSSEPVAGPMGIQIDDYSINENNIVQEFNIRNDKECNCQVVQEQNHQAHFSSEAMDIQDSPLVTVIMETPRSASNNYPGQSMEMESPGQENASKIERAKKRLAFEKEDLNKSK